MNPAKLITQLAEQFIKEAALSRFIKKDKPIPFNQPYPMDFPPLRPAKKKEPGNTPVENGASDPDDFFAPTPFPTAPLAGDGQRAVALPRSNRSPSSEWSAKPVALPQKEIEEPKKVTPVVLNKTQLALAKLFERAYTARLTQEREEYGGELPSGMILKIMTQFRQLMEKNIAKAPSSQRHDMTVALHSVIAKLEGESNGRTKEEILGELDSKYKELLATYPKDEDGSYDVQDFHNRFLQEVESHEEYKPYIAEFLENASLLPDEPSPVMRHNDQGYPNLSDQVVRGLIEMNGVDATSKMPHFLNNEENKKKLDQVVQEITSSRDIDRKGMAKAFQQSYLKPSNGADAKTYYYFYKMFIDNVAKITPNEAFKLLKSKNGPQNSNAFRSRLQNIDVTNFIDNVLFMPDDFGKENFIKYYLTADNKALLSILSASGATPDEIRTIQDKKGENVKFKQDVCIKYIKPLADHVMQLIANRDDKFFEWAAAEAWRWGGRGMEGKTRQQATRKNDHGGEDVVDFEDTRGNLGLNSDQEDIMDEMNEQEAEFGGESLSRPGENEMQKELADNDLFESQGLKGNKRVARPGGIVKPEQLTSFFENYGKIHSLYEDVLGGIQKKYQQAAASLKSGNPSGDEKDVMLNMLQRELFFSRIFSHSSDFVKNLFSRSSNNSAVKVTDNRMANIINQQWDNVMDYKDWANFAWTPDDQQIASLVQKGVQDGLGTPESVYKGLVGKVTANNGELNTLAIQQKVPSGLPGMASIYLDPEIVNKHGKAALISFIDMTGYYSGTAKLGTLLSNTHPETFNDKLEYLTELVRRGVITEYSEADIENMPIQEVAQVFGGVRRQLQGLYGLKNDTVSAIEDPTNKYITDQDIAEVAASMNMPQINSKQTFQAQPPKIKKELAEKMFVTPKFQRFKLYIDKDENTLRSILEYYAEKEESKNSGLFDEAKMSSPLDLYSMPRRRLIQIAQKYFPQIYQAYTQGRLNDTKVQGFLKQVRKTDTKELEQKVVQDFFAQINQDSNENVDGEESTASRKAILEQAMVFANILDLPNEHPLAAAASSVWAGLKKIAMQKRINSIVSLRNKFAQHNADTSVLDSIVEELISRER